MKILFTDEEYKQFQLQNPKNYLDIISIALVGEEIYKRRIEVLEKIENDIDLQHYLESPRTKNEVRNLCKTCLD